jgi:hypothetical protein
MHTGASLFMLSVWNTKLWFNDTVFSNLLLDHYVQVLFTIYQKIYLYYSVVIERFNETIEEIIMYNSSKCFHVSLNL